MNKNITTEEKEKIKKLVKDNPIDWDKNPELKKIVDESIEEVSRKEFIRACEQKGITEFHTTNIDPSTVNGLIKLTAIVEGLDDE